MSAHPLNEATASGSPEGHSLEQHEGPANAAPAVAVMILAFVHPFMVSHVERALHAIHGVTGATFTAARGFGRGRGRDAPEAEVIAGTSDKVRVEVAVPAALEEIVVRAIRDAARTGGRGDGKVYVLPVSRAVRVATGEEGAAAI